MSNLSRCVRYHAIRTPDRLAIVYQDARISYGELWQRIQTVAGMLRGKGVKPGDRVSLLMKNSTAFLELVFAISHVGAVLVPINFRLAADEVDYILTDSGTTLFFCDEEFRKDWTPACPATVYVDAATQADARLLGPSNGDEGLQEVGDGDLMRLMYTSGTTARPKGVMHVYRSFYSKSSDHIVELNLSAETRLLMTGPLYHVGALDLPGIGVLWAGGMVCIQREFDPAVTLDLIERERLNGSWLAPVMTGQVLALQAESPRDTSSLLWTIGGGERTPESRIRAYTEAFPNGRYIDAYGMTETFGGDTFMQAGRELEKIGSVGRTVSQVDIEIRDEDGNTLPAGEHGEICVRGVKVTKGYWNAAEKTKESFFGDWLRTGDGGYLDEEGFLFLTDRIKDMIISGGEDIASSEIERAIMELPAILDAAVIGVPSERWGERPVAFIVLKPESHATEADIIAHCRSRLAGFKVPDRAIFTAELPRTASGKVLKRNLREVYAADSTPA